MALSLDGTTGITSDGGTPVIENLDTTATGIAVTGELTTTGNVGIGKTPTDKALELYASAATAIRIQNSTTGTGSGDGFLIEQSGLDSQIVNYEAGNLKLYTSGSERACIDASGNLLVGTTTVGGLGHSIQANGTRISTMSGTGNNVHAEYKNGNGTVGYILSSGSSTSYVTSSDYRLKEDWVAVANASTRVNALKPINFAWLASGARVDGFLAHELAEVVPEAVTGTKDAMRDEEYEVTSAVLDDEGAVVTPAVMGTRSVPDYQGIDQSKLVPLLTAALQEALAAIDDLTARVSALEAK